MLKKTVTLAGLDDDVNGIVELVALSAGGAQSFVQDGALVVRVAELSTAVAIIFTSAGDDSLLSFTITGTDSSDQTQVEVLAGANVGVATTLNTWNTITGITSDGNTASTIEIGTVADDNGIVASVTLSGGGTQSFVFDGVLIVRTGTFAAGQIVVCTATGDETGRVFTLTGVDVDGITISEALAGPNATTVKSTINFKTITDITSDANTLNTVSFGTLKEDLGYSATLDVHQRRGTAIDDTLWLNVISGTLAVTAQITDERNAGIFTNSRAIDGLWLDHASFTAQAADKVAKNDLGCFGYRLKYTAYTSGSVELAVLTTTD